MVVTLKNNKRVLLRQLTVADVDALVDYLNALSPATRSRFGPHSFDKTSISLFYNSAHNNNACIAEDPENQTIVGYAIIKTGFLPHDAPRLQAYGLTLSETSDCTFAPSVADAWQGCGLGKSLYNFILPQLQSKPIQRIILWGGVQAGNTAAINYYTSLGFVTLGEFEYNGLNYDMVKTI